MACSPNSWVVLHPNHAPRVAASRDEWTWETTHWSRLMALGTASPMQRRATLDHLFRHYWQPAYEYVRALRQVGDDEARDVVQDVFTHFVERRSLEHLSPQRGSFRAFLRTALRNASVSVVRSAAVRPGLLAFGGLAVEPDGGLHGGRQAAPDAVFDRVWAETVLARAVRRFSEELTSSGRTTQLAVFAAYCLDDATRPTYDELASRFGISAHDVRNRLRESRRRLREILASLASEYVAPGESLHGELAFLLSR